MTYAATALLVLIGGALGAIGRYLVSEAIHARRKAFSHPVLPLATLAVNVSGSFLLGFVAGLAELGSRGAPGGLALIGIGFCGALTTFSAFSVDVIVLAAERAWSLLVRYVAASVAGALVAVWLGLQLAATFG